MGKAAEALEALKADTTPSFQFLASLLDLVAQGNDKRIEHISKFLIFFQGSQPKVEIRLEPKALGARQSGLLI